MKINDSKLSIVKLSFTKGDSKITGIDKKCLRYQRVLLTSPYKSESHVLPVPTSDISIPAVCKRAGYTEAWVIVKDVTKTKWTREKYSIEDKDVMLKWLKYLYPAHLDTAEILVRAIYYGNVTRKFYEAYGTDAIREFYRLIDNITVGSVRGTGKTDKKYSKQYTSLDRYNIFDFLKDIVAARDVEIYTDPDLIGQYKRISRKLKFSGTIIPDKWCKVGGITGNRTRANLSLSYSANVTIDVPENEFGVTPGPRELKTSRSFCIVKDGVVWGKWLGIKTSNRALVKKMQGAGMIETGIIYEDEYLVNLETLPPISKGDTRFITSYRLAKAEVGVYLNKVGSAWARRMKVMDRDKLTVCPKTLEVETISESEKYLHTLGIYGDTYVPPKYETDAVSSSYETYEVIGHLTKMSDPGLVAYKWINGDRSLVMSEFLEKISKEHSESGRSWDEEVKYWENNIQKAIRVLRELKYRFILGKTLKFADKRETKVENVTVDVPVEGKLIRVFWTVEKNKVVI